MHAIASQEQSTTAHGFKVHSFENGACLSQLLGDGRSVVVMDKLLSSSCTSECRQRGLLESFFRGG
jgi:hypothetical protein